MPWAWRCLRWTPCHKRSFAGAQGCLDLLGAQTAWEMCFLFGWIRGGYFLYPNNYMIIIWSNLGSCLILIFLDGCAKCQKVGKLEWFKFGIFMSRALNTRNISICTAFGVFFYPTTSKGSTSHPQGRRGTTTSLYAEIMSLFAQYRNFSGFQWNLDSHQSVAGHEETWNEDQETYCWWKKSG